MRHLHPSSVLRRRFLTSFAPGLGDCDDDRRVCFLRALSMGGGVPDRIVMCLTTIVVSHQKLVLKTVADHLRSAGKRHQLTMTAADRKLATITKAILKSGKMGGPDFMSIPTAIAPDELPETSCVTYRAQKPLMSASVV